MQLTFTPSPDVNVVLNMLLDIYERRIVQAAKSAMTRETRAIKVILAEISLPTYFSQLDPAPRFIANEQFNAVEKAGWIKLTWVLGETGHILNFVTLQTEHASQVYEFLNRPAKITQQKNLESLLLAEKFRFVDDWRARAIRQILGNLRAGKSPAPFSLTDPALNTDLLTVMEALPALQAETPYRVFSVRIFNDSKRLEVIKSQLVSLARLGSPEWKRLPPEEILRELNLVPNPTYVHLAGDWELTLETGEILTLGGFAPSVGFPAAQTGQLQRVIVHAKAVLCIENLTTFHEFIRAQHATGNLSMRRVAGTKYAIICSYGNPSPATRRILRLLPAETPLYHWSDLDYGGFNILSQLRRLVRDDIQPYRMDIATIDSNYPRSRPLTVADKLNLKKLLVRPELCDARPVIEYLLKRGVKLEQEGIE